LAVRLIGQIADLVGHDLPLATLFEGATIEHLADLLRKQAGDRQPTVIVPIQTGGDRRPFFCVHPMGGNVLCYLDLARHLGDRQPFYGIQAVGLNGEAEPFERFEPMAARYIQSMKALQPEGPYRLGGWSLGGVIAFEMARQIESEGETVSLLALMDSTPPIPENAPPEFESDYNLLSNLARDLEVFSGTDLAVSYEELARMSLDEMLSYLVERATRAGAIPSDFGLRQLRRLYQLQKANFEALRHYQPSPYPGPITVFEATGKSEWEYHGPMSGWSRLSTRPVATHVIPGDHLTIITRPHVETLARLLEDMLS